MGVDRGFSWSAPVSSADKMQMAATAASSGGYVLDGHQNTNFKAISSQRPLVDLSEAEASRTCSALKRRRNSASGLWHSGKINARMLLCVFCLIPFIRWCANQIDGVSRKYVSGKMYMALFWCMLRYVIACRGQCWICVNVEVNYGPETFLVWVCWTIWLRPYSLYLYGLFSTDNFLVLNKCWYWNLRFWSSMSDV